MDKKQIFITAGIAVLASFASAGIINKLSNNDNTKSATQLLYTASSAMGADFRKAATTSVPSVVHITTTLNSRGEQPGFNPFDFFGGRDFFMQPPSSGSGSGVVISSDGYIVTNNHVIDGADELTVTFANQKEYSAKVIGTDPSTDIAVLKIDANNLPALSFGNSDNVQLGEWVLAVGYPLNLDATVTAGIVSAKSRNIGINKTKANNAIESFIQTDAAVNPGNSGGALVNTLGELIGINSAIASPTGSYAGYSYAIPSNMVKKVVDDIIKFGKVQRAYLGINYMPLSSNVNSKLNLDKDEKGIYIMDVSEGGAAQKAGLKKGDIIITVNNKEVTNEANFSEIIAVLRPGESVDINFSRDGKIRTTTLKATSNPGISANSKNKYSEPDINEEDTQGENLDWLVGLNLRSISKSESDKMRLEGGVQILSISGNSPLYSLGVKKDFIITKANGKNIESIEDLENAISGKRSIELIGKYPNNAGNYYYSLSR